MHVGLEVDDTGLGHALADVRLGRIDGSGDACEVQSASRWQRMLVGLGLRAAPEARPEQVAVRYQVPELWVYVADEFGLLNADQVERIALHEIGHALGMRSHSPVPNDLMFQMVRERPGPARLSFEDVNSFVSLYALPNGTVYHWLPGPGDEAPQHVTDSYLVP